MRKLGDIGKPRKRFEVLPEEPLRAPIPLPAPKPAPAPAPSR